MAYQPIDSYGLIGNMRTAALVSRDGSVDWMCLPCFDSPSVFGAILDDRKGGRLSVRPTGKFEPDQQYYVPDTNVLVTRMRTEGKGRQGRGAIEVTDFMPVSPAEHDPVRPDLVRIIAADEGEIEVEIRCEPAFDYARQKSEASAWRSEEGDTGGVRFRARQGTVVVSATCELKVEGGAAVGRVRVTRDRPVALLMRFQKNGEAREPRSADIAEARELLDDTISYWRSWVARCTYRGRWREQIRRSSLALKLHQYEPTGAVVAAVTCSLPEHIGGPRNWDYRYVWPRDAAFTVDALLQLGFHREAERFMCFMYQRCGERKPDEPLAPLFGIDGRRETPEEELDHLEGYRGSSPVRIGNAANGQLQLDVPGILMDAVNTYDLRGVPISDRLWRELRELLDWTCDNWDRPDEGIWEVRSEPKNFVSSRVMCWVALQRGLEIAARRGFPAERERWAKERDRIYEQVMERGWDEERGAFVQRYDDDALDAANLIMPMVGFISPGDPKMLAMLRAIDSPKSERGLRTGFSVHRYDPDATDDGVGGEEGGFNMCTFWLIEALTRAGKADHRCLERARTLMDRMIGHANHLGLYAEQLGSGGEALGNYPQALTHLSLIEAVLRLDKALDEAGSRAYE